MTRDWPYHPKLNPKALPIGEDPVRQEKDGNHPQTRAVIQNYNGIGYTSVNPADPSVDVGPNHVVQMINGSSGAYIKIFDKAGTVLLNQTYFDGITGIPGLGDPIVIYDQLADRWMCTEFSSTGNKMVVGISQTSSPLGAWYIYSFTAPSFPDYPKYAIWPDAYYVTTNENSPSVYAFDRTKMLAGDPSATMQRFTLSAFPTIGFQAATPVSLSGNLLPPSGSPGLIMRMGDDGWGSPITNDRLEIFEFHVDFTTPANSNISGPLYLNTQPFDTDLCGYQTLSCINQPGNTNLDPLREVLMNRIFYRNFGDHASLVCCHVTDANGSDLAGVRWYELRKNSSNPWSIYQQGTYSPDNSFSRWMSSIAINGSGQISIAYNITNNSLAPSIRYTGRNDCDPLGTMTISETTIVNGGSTGNGSNRYGDYNQLNVDPSNDNTFWFTAMYNPAAQWSTRIASYEVEDNCIPAIRFVSAQTVASENQANMDNACIDFLQLKLPVVIPIAPSNIASIGLDITGSAFEGVNKDFHVFPDSIYLENGHLSDTFYVNIYDDAYIEMMDSFELNLVINANGGDAQPAAFNQSHKVFIHDDDVPPSNNIPYIIDLKDFENNALSPYTTTNSAAATPFQIDNAAGASSSSWTVPNTNGSLMAYVNDDDCNCNMSDVRLITPVLDFSLYDSCVLSFDVFYLEKTYQGITEDARILISTNGGSNYTDIYNMPSATAWTNRSINLTSYTGPGFNNVKIAFQYKDGGGWLYGLALDNIKLETSIFTSIENQITTSNPSIAYLGAESEVYFYHPTSGKVIAKVINESLHDFGCVNLAIDRNGNQYFFDGNNVGDVAAKTFLLSSEFPSLSDSVKMVLYYNLDELSPWITSENSACDSISSLFPIASSNAISLETLAFDKADEYLTKTFDNVNYEMNASHTIIDGGHGIADPRRTGKVYVKQTATGTANGSTWSNAYPTIDEALTWARNCPDAAQIRIAKGTYSPTSGLDGTLPVDQRDRTFHINKNLVIVASFAGVDGLPENADSTLRDFAMNVTTLSGDLAQNDAPNFSNREDNVYKVMFLDSDGTIVLDGLYVEGGNGMDGAGMYIQSNAVLKQIQVTDNVGTNTVFVKGLNKNVIFQVCTIENNQGQDLISTQGATVEFIGVNHVK